MAEIRETLSQEYEKLEQAQETPVVTEAPPQTEVPVESKPDRVRDEQGRFTEKPKEAAPEKPVPPQVPQVAARPPRPSTWKKEYWEHFDKLDPNLAAYINQREGEFTKGVSAYKAEYDRVRPISDAVKQFDADIKQIGTTPDKFVTNLGMAHRQLATGTPEAKLSMFLKLAQDYQVPVQNLFIRGQDGQVYYNPQVQAFQQQQTQPPSKPTEEIVRDIIQQEKAQQSLAEFESQVQEKYPHYEAVRGTMAQLLDAGFSQTLEEAYETSLKLPQHADLFVQVQQARADQEKAEAARKLKEEADRARRNTVSVRSATPAVKSGDGKPRSIRESLEAAIEQHAGGDRV